MGFRAKGRLAFAIAAALAFAALTAKPLYACESCPPGPNTQGLPANALPTYPEATEEASEPVKLRKFSKSQTRAARYAQPRKATLAQRARAGKYAQHKAKPVDDEETVAPVQAKSDKKISLALANANAALVEMATVSANTAQVTEPAQAAPVETQVNSAEPPAVELVSAEEFNDLDKAAWEANQMPKLMKLASSDSRAELREDDSKWAQTSTIGKLFVAFGALLTIGSAVRMFMA